MTSALSGNKPSHGPDREKRTLRLVRDCNQALIRARGETELMESICRIVVERGGYRMAWVGLAETAGNLKIVRPIAHAGYVEGYLDGLKVTWNEAEHGRGPTGTAVRTGRPVFIRSMRDDPDFAPWREAALDRGYACSIALPLSDQGQVYGALTIYAAAPDAFDETEAALLAELAGDLAYGLKALRTAAEHARLEDGLRDSKTRLSLILDNISDAIFSVEAEPAGEFRFSWVNRRFLEMTGRTSGEAVGKAVEGILPGPFPGFFAGKYREVVRTGKPVSWEVESGFPPDRRWGLATVVPLFDDRGNCRQLIGMIHDLTGSKRAEAEREKLRNQLFQSQKLESIGRLAGGVAHDFNNMLTVIISCTDMILRRIDPSDPLSSELQKILVAARHSADLTRQLLAFARKETVTPSLIDLNGVVGDAVPFLRRLLGETIELVWRPGWRTGRVRVGATQIDQVLTNLCVNSRDAIQGPGKIVIETGSAVFSEADCEGHPGARPGEYARLSVADNGHGMGEDILSRIFEPFYTTKAPGKGTGLGLSTVYGIVQQNKGFITVKSEPGRGASFDVFLPRHDESPTPPPPVAEALPQARSRTTLLLVEDEPAILQVTAQILQNLGYTVLAASHPAEALQLARAQPGGIHILITDVVMPGMSGVDLARELRPLFPGLKRLFMSGYAAGSIADPALLEEGTYFLQKPFTIQELAVTVRDALR